MKDRILAIFNNHLSELGTNISHHNNVYTTEELEAALDGLLEIITDIQNKKLQTNLTVEFVEFFDYAKYNTDERLIQKLNSVLGDEIVTKNNFISYEEFQKEFANLLSNNIFIQPFCLINALIDNRRQDFFILISEHFELKGHKLKKGKKKKSEVSFLEHKFYNLNKKYKYFTKNNIDFKRNADVGMFNLLDMMVKQIGKITGISSDKNLLRAINSKLSETYYLTRVDFIGLMEVQNEIYKYLPELKISQNEFLFRLRFFFEMVYCNRKVKCPTIENYKKGIDSYVLKTKPIAELNSEFRNYYLQEIKLLLSI